MGTEACFGTWVDNLCCKCIASTQDVACELMNKVKELSQFLLLKNLAITSPVWKGKVNHHFQIWCFCHLLSNHVFPYFVPSKLISLFCYLISFQTHNYNTYYLRIPIWCYWEQSSSTLYRLRIFRWDPWRDVCGHLSGNSHKRLRNKGRRWFQTLAALFL